MWVGAFIILDRHFGRKMRYLLDRGGILCTRHGWTVFRNPDGIDLHVASIESKRAA